MHRPSIRFGNSPPTESLWGEYLFALAASALAYGVEIWLNDVLRTAVTPFLPGFAAIIASAAWAGFGPGLLATALVSGWCGLILYQGGHNTLVEEAVRLGIFGLEGILLSIGSGHLRRATREVSRSDEWHRRLIETSGEGIWVSDSAGAISYANPRIAEILGTRPDAIAGRKMEDFFFPADLAVERIRFQNRRAGLKEQFDRRLRRADGSEVWVLACSTPCFDAAMRFQGALSMMTDITERKRAEHALRRSEERFRGLFENVLEGVYQSTPDGRIIAANPMLLRMLGLANEAEMNDVNIAQDLYVDTDVRKRLLEHLESDGSFQNVEYQLRRRDGHIITVQENARVVRDEDGNVLYYEGTLADISERNLVEERLRQAQKTEALGRLAGGVAHDFSNVLTLISGYARLTLGEISESHPARGHAQQVVNAAESATALTEQLLSFSRRQTPPGADLNRAVGKCEEALRRVIGDYANLVVCVAPGPLPVFADQTHVEQIVVNLAINARNGMRAGGTLEVRTGLARLNAAFCRQHPGANPGPYAALSVRATGPEAIEGGPGFGFSVTQAMVSQHRGFMLVQTDPERESTITVYLPRAEDAESDFTLVEEKNTR